jgi:ABC-type dipeptide/oligopeptide/nickel transport system permease subunit
MRALRRFSHHRAAVVASGCLVLLGLFVGLWPVWSSLDPNAVDFSLAMQGPSLAHPLGTDVFGRDIVARMAVGGRISLLVAAGAAAVVGVVGLLYGTIAGVAGGRVDELLMRIVDGLFAIPRLPFYIVVLVVATGRDTGTETLIVALSAVSWLATARLVRMQAATLRTSDYVRAARALGASRARIALRHVAPNALGIMVVGVLLELPSLLLGEALVSVLGLGPNPPTATWGNIAQDGIYHDSVRLVLVPSLAIAGFAVCASYVADGVQEALDPRRDWARERRLPGLARRLLGSRLVPEPAE